MNLFASVVSLEHLDFLTLDQPLLRFSGCSGPDTAISGAAREGRDVVRTTKAADFVRLASQLQASSSRSWT